MKPQVDILMAVYNGHKYIEPQIESILNQTHRNIRLIIRDDASKDRTSDLLRYWQKKHSSRMQVIYAEQNGGIIANFSALMEEVQAPYIMFADQDDVWKIDKVALTISKMIELEHTNAPETPLLVHSDLRVVDKELREISSSFWNYATLFPQKSFSLGRQITQNTITGCTVMVNQPLLKLAKPLPHEEVVMHDWWLGLVASAFGQIGIVREQTILYRQHENNEIGAKAFSWDNLRASFARKAETRKQTQKQAEAFLRQYGTQLPEEKKSIIEGYLRMQDSWTGFQRGYLMLKYGLYKQGLLRNLNQMILG